MTKPPRKPRAKPTMHKPKRLCRNQLSICKKAEILHRILYDKVWLQDICDEFDLPACTVCTWKKNSDKICTDSVKVGKKRIRMHMNHKMSTMLMKHLYITSVYLTGLMNLSMRGCMYSQSGRIPTGQMTAGRITFVFFFCCT